eukprot:CAMPEP_0197187178 /NCGR_PEP_ID=MMETSP1423-20130617/15367_1 /TAXON_ID=476441 /ORGANISM="Pseudo-nitzschia heimii, Strain UNC1101" /LENGTH=401 /DNA_ID=CAMNT_0042638683 /DNA_START=207 /DNA_END=1412 /DNA_ORIENTATION=+
MPSISTRSVPKCSCRIISILVLVLIVSCRWQPVAAYTTSRTISDLNNSRHRINNNNLVRTPPLTSALDGNSIGNGDDERIEVRTQTAPSNRSITRGARRFGIVRAIQVARRLCYSPFDVIRSWNAAFRKGYYRRINADPSFFGKSVTEVLVAAGTQLMAEWNRRGSSRIVLELDFVFPAILTAVFGKYYSMWRTAKTLDDNEDKMEDAPSSKPNYNAESDPLVFGLPVPTNAFQSKMADGITSPTTKQRLGSFLAAVSPLFKAGTIASSVGYGIASVLVALRTRLIQTYQTETVPVNVLYASIYTGCFMAVVSNLRFQILQGLVEPILIDRWIFPSLQNNTNGEVQKQGDKGRREMRVRLQEVLRSILIFLVRWLNGLLGSVLAINGMRMFGLQQIKIDGD